MSDLILKELREKILEEISVSNGKEISIFLGYEEKCVSKKIISELRMDGFTVKEGYSSCGGERDAVYWLEINK